MTNAAPYNAMAIQYKNRNPKYIELYSRKPPNIAPIRLLAIAPETSLLELNSVEKTIPEKNSGQVNTTTAAIRPSTVGSNPTNFMISPPPRRLANRSMYGTVRF